MKRTKVGAFLGRYGNRYCLRPNGRTVHCQAGNDAKRIRRSYGGAQGADRKHLPAARARGAGYASFRRAIYREGPSDRGADVIPVLIFCGKSESRGRSGTLARWCDSDRSHVRWNDRKRGRARDTRKLGGSRGDGSRPHTNGGRQSRRAVDAGDCGWFAARPGDRRAATAAIIKSAHGRKLLSLTVRDGGRWGRDGNRRQCWVHEEPMAAGTKSHENQHRKSKRERQFTTGQHSESPRIPDFNRTPGRARVAAGTCLESSPYHGYIVLPGSSFIVHPRNAEDSGTCRRFPPGRI